MDGDTRMSDVVAEGVEPLRERLQLSVLAIIKPAQRQYGLQHGDYARYRCVHVIN